jgi:hypothetical protein
MENPKSDRRLYEVGCELIKRLEEGELHFPLTSSLIIETYKMANDQHRMLIAELQAQMSQGRVYRDRNFVIRHEMARFLWENGDAEFHNPPHFWWMSKYFIEAFVDIPRAVGELGLESDQVEGLRENPKFAMYHWIATAPPDEREKAIGYFEDGSKRLIAAIEERIARLADQKPSLRERVYSASLAIEEIDRILAVCQASGLNWTNVADLGERRIKRIMRTVPTYQVEISLALRIEGLKRPIAPNDLRDMQSYVVAIPNADVLIGEKLFINLAIQSGLNKKYGCNLHTKMYTLEAYF